MRNLSLFFVVGLIGCSLAATRKHAIVNNMQTLRPRFVDAFSTGFVSIYKTHAQTTINLAKQGVIFSVPLTVFINKLHISICSDD